MSENQTHKQEPVAALYAKALFELAKEKGDVEQVQQGLAEAAELLRQNPHLAQALGAFMFSVEDREKLAQEVGKKAELHPLVLRLMDLLISKNRIQILESVALEYRSLLDAGKGILRGTVTAVEQLSETEVADLAKAFGRKFSKNIVLDPVVDKDILGGLIVKIQGLTFDGSLKTTIRRLKENLERQSI